MAAQRLSSAEITAGFDQLYGFFSRPSPLCVCMCACVHVDVLSCDRVVLSSHAGTTRPGAEGTRESKGETEGETERGYPQPHYHGTLTPSCMFVLQLSTALPSGVP
jgi:hypothetical protein